MKQREGAMLLAYCIPYSFLALYADITYHSAFAYLLVLLAAIFLGLMVRRSFRLPTLLLGNGLSLAVSCLILSFFRTPGWNIWFKPFGPFGMAILLQCICLMLQYGIFQWKRQRSTAETFFLALSGAVLALGAVIYLILYMQAAQIGAV